MQDVRLQLQQHTVEEKEIYKEEGEVFEYLARMQGKYI